MEPYYGLIIQNKILNSVVQTTGQVSTKQITIYFNL